MFLHGVSHVLEDRNQDLLVTPVKFLLVVPPVRKAEEGSEQPVRVGEGVHQGGASSRRWKGRVLPSKGFHLLEKTLQEYGSPQSGMGSRFPSKGDK